MLLTVLQSIRRTAPQRQGSVSTSDLVLEASKLMQYIVVF